MSNREHSPARACVICGGTFIPKSSKHKFCSWTCSRDAAWANKRPKSIGRLCDVSTGTVGAMSELRVSADLLARGYDVFRSLSPACPCDLVIMTASGALLRVEVKTTYRSETTGRMSDPLCAHNEFDVIACACDDEIIYIPKLARLGGGILP